MNNIFISKLKQIKQIFLIFTFIPISILLTCSLLTVSASTLPTKNQTNLIDIEAKIINDKIIIDYNIDYTIGTESEFKHGIFLALPNNQDGVLTNYDLTKPPQKDYSDEKYDIIKEIDSFRLRIGDSNIQLESKKYKYNFQITANVETNYNYNFSFIKGWLNNSEMISGKLNGIDICTNSSNPSNYCDSSNIQAKLNPDKPPINSLIKIWNNFKNYIIAGFLSLLPVIGVWINSTNQKNKKLIMQHKPAFEPPENLTPWEADYLIKDGKIDFKSTFLSYILYLNHLKYIQITPNENTSSKDKINLKLLKNLPDNLVPEFMNNLLNDVIQYGFTDGLQASNIEPDVDKVRNHTFNNIQKFYSRKPIYYPIIFVIGISIVGLIIWMSIIAFFQESLLIGNSIRNLGFFVIPILSLVTYPILNNWSKLTPLGWDQRNHSEGWKYYLTNVEKYKLDFSNNPDEGVQYYLNTVPFAAQFGILDKFNKYFNSLKFTELETINNSNLLNQTLIYSTFYTNPVDSNGGDSGGSSGGFDGGGGGW